MFCYRSKPRALGTGSLAPAPVRPERQHGDNDSQHFILLKNFDVRNQSLLGVCKIYASEKLYAPDKIRDALGLPLDADVAFHEVGVHFRSPPGLTATQY